MKRHTLWILALLTSAALALPVAAQAQSASGATTKHSTATKKSAAKKAPARKAKSKKGAAAKKAKAEKAKEPVESPKEEQASAIEQQTAGQIQTGTFACELGGKVSVTADAANPGVFSVVSGKRRYEMHPVASRTGAIRLEDEHRGAVWLQLAVKSMLMDQKAGQRLADGCASPEQKAYAAQLQNQPQRQLFSAPTGSSEQQQGGGAATGAPAGTTPPFAPVTGGSTSQPASETAPVLSPMGGNRPPSGN